MITAGASGIGAAIAQAFLSTGARVAVCDVDSVALDAFSAKHPKALSIRGDVSSPKNVEEISAQVLSAFGGLDVLINNAGIAGPTAEVGDVGFEQWERVIAVNLTGPFLMIAAFAEAFKTQRCGCIINVSSSSARHAIPCRTPYVASKCGLEGLSASVARELGPHGVRSNVIAPGFVDNERSTQIIARLAEARGVSTESVEKEALQFITLRRKVRMEEIAAVCQFLASDQAGAITGQVIPVDANVEWES